MKISNLRKMLTITQLALGDINIEIVELSANGGIKTHRDLKFGVGHAFEGTPAQLRFKGYK